MRFTLLTALLLSLAACTTSPEPEPLPPPNLTHRLWWPIEDATIVNDPLFQQPLPLLYHTGEHSNLFFWPITDKIASTRGQLALPSAYQPFDAEGRGWALTTSERRHQGGDWADTLIVGGAGDTLTVVEGAETWHYAPVDHLTWIQLISRGGSALSRPLFWQMETAEQVMELHLHQQDDGTMTVFSSVINKVDSTFMLSYHTPPRGVPAAELAVFPYWEREGRQWRLHYLLPTNSNEDQLYLWHLAPDRRTAVTFRAQPVEQAWSEPTRQTLAAAWAEAGLPAFTEAPESPRPTVPVLWKGSSSYTVIAPSKKWFLLLDDLQPNIQIHPPLLIQREDGQGFAVWGKTSSLQPLQ